MFGKVTQWIYTSHLITFKLYLGGEEYSSHVDSIPVHLRKRITTIIIIIVIIIIINYGH